VRVSSVSRHWRRREHISTRTTSWKYAVIAVALIAAAYLIGGAQGDGKPVPTDGPGSSLPAHNVPASSEVIGVGELPPEARTTLQLIESGGPFPYSKDGTVFHNYEGVLPEKPDGYYREYTVVTPGSSDRGARRVVAGNKGERYYTDDHYSTFQLIVE